MKRTNSVYGIFEDDSLVRPSKIIKLINKCDPFITNCEPFSLGPSPPSSPSSYKTEEEAAEFSSPSPYEPFEDRSRSSSPEAEFSRSSFELDLSRSSSSPYQLKLDEFSEHVVSLNLAYWNYLSDDDIISLLGSKTELFPKIKTLNVSHTPISDSAVKLLTTKCPNLTSIDLSGCLEVTDVSLSFLAQNCKTLQDLNLNGCPKIGDTGVQLIAQEVKGHLLSLDMNDCPLISDKALMYLGYYCENLACLRLKNTHVSVGVLAKLLPRIHLKELNVQGVQITDAFLLALCRFQEKTLRVLDISFCYRVTLNGICKIIQDLGFLEELHMFGLTTTDEHIKEFALRRNLSLFF